MTKTFWTIIIIGVLVILSPFMDGIAGADEVKQIGIMANGPVFEVTESNGFLYAGQGGEVHVYNVTTRDQILHLNWSSRIAKFHEPRTLGWRIRTLIVKDSLLYGTDNGEFFITDISDPTSPFPLASLNISSSAMAMSEDGGYAYLSGPSGLQVVDTSDKTHPVVVAVVPEGTRGWRMTVSGNLLFVTRGSAFSVLAGPNLMIFDISNPANPVLTSAFEPRIAGGYTGADSLDGRYVFAVDYYHWVHVIDASNPVNPVIVANITGSNGTAINANDIIIRGNYAYVSTRYEGFRVYDITDPTHPVHIGTGKSEVGGYTEGIFVNGQYVYLAVESMGTEIYDVTNPATPKRLIHIYTLGGANSITTEGDYLVVGAHNDGIWIIDATDKANLKEISFGFDNGRNDAVATVGNTLYVAGNWAGLFIFDITNKYKPVQIKKVTSPCYNVMVSPDWKYLYTTRQIIDITNLWNPTIMYSSTGFNPWAQKGDYLFGAYDTAGGGIGLGIFNVVNKSAPFKEYTFNPDTSYSDIAVSGNTAIVTGNNFIHSYDISDITNPKLLKRFSYSGFMASKVIIVGERVYISGETGTRIFDLTDPVNLPFIESSDYPVSYSDGRYLYANGKFGIGIYTLSGPAVTPTQTQIPPTPVPTPTPIITPTPVPGLPAITSIEPDSWPAGGSAIGLKIVGNEFDRNCTVLWNGVPTLTRYYSSNYVIAPLSGWTLQNPKIVNISIRNPNGNVSNKMLFNIYTPTPIPTPVTPTPTIPTTLPTTLPTTEPTTIETTEPIPTPTDPICSYPTITPVQPKKICIEISETSMRLIPCPGG